MPVLETSIERTFTALILVLILLVLSLSVSPQPPTIARRKCLSMKKGKSITLFQFKKECPIHIPNRNEDTFVRQGATTVVIRMPTSPSWWKPILLRCELSLSLCCSEGIHNAWWWTSLAKKEGNDLLSFVYKILMNSLYGRFGINPKSTRT